MLEHLPTSIDPIGPFVRRITEDVKLNDKESALLQSISSLGVQVQAGECIRSEDKMRCWIVTSGWAYYTRTAADGRRQIFSFIVPGDAIGIVDGPFEVDKTEVLALTSVGLIDASRVRVASANDDSCDNIRHACEIERSRECVRLLDHIFRLGRLSAEERMAHLLLELNHRLERVGLAHSGSFEFPPSQAQLGDALGLSLVHTNRVMQSLRAEGLLTNTQKRTVSLDLEGLARRARPGSESSVDYA
jgi:CRP-like cAMP-binding protein